MRFKSGQHVTFKIQDPARPAHLTQQNCSPIATFVLSVSHSVTNRVRTPTNFSIALPCLSHASGPCSNFSHPKDGFSSRPKNWLIIAISFHPLCRPHPASTATATATCQTTAGAMERIDEARSRLLSSHPVVRMLL